MKTIFLFLLFSDYFFNFSFSQNPLVKMWDYRYGGDSTEWLYCFQETNDGGYILGGQTRSDISGDITESSRGTIDFWIIKIDSLGQKDWDKRYGGFDYDQLFAFDQTSDGGYILGGCSKSGISGDKTQATWGDRDYWIIKIDSLGNKQWDKDFGGTDQDVLCSIQQTFDGGYIISGVSLSGVSGDKTEPSKGDFDFWILKTDSIGNLMWNKDYGGIDYEGAAKIKQTPDSGFIVEGFSFSGIGGDKTQPLWGSFDIWVVKLDSTGNKLWDKDFGGIGTDIPLDVCTTADKGFFISGISDSGIGGDKTEPTWNNSRDYWVIKIDSAGNKLWDKDFGGTNNEDELGSGIQNYDRGFLIAGTSYSSISGNKTESNLGIEQTWIIKIDSLGSVQWDKTLLTTTPFDDESGFALETQDGCYVMANSTLSGIGGDKSETSRGLEDFWIIKFCDTTKLPEVDFTSTSNICAGACTGFINLSVYAMTYQWSFPGATPDTSTSTNPLNICYTTPGTYDIQLIASNANGSDTLTLQNYITVFPHPAPQSITQSGDTLFAIAGASSYQWYYNGNIISGATNYFYVAHASGDYNVVATDSNGCEVEAVINDVIADINQLAVGNWQLAIVPNPVTETLYIRGLKNNSVNEIKIFNVYGEKVFSAVHCLPVTVDCLLFPAGVYYLEIASGKRIFRAKFVKQ